jgi:hypothetical protein
MVDQVADNNIIIIMFVVDQNQMILVDEVE